MRECAREVPIKGGHVLAQPPVVTQLQKRTHAALTRTRYYIVNKIDIFKFIQHGYPSLGSHWHLLNKLKFVLKIYIQFVEISAKMFGLDPTGVY